MLSIIIPTLNEEKYLPLLLGSIKKQDFKDYEIIVSDGGSKDKTLEIAKNHNCQILRGGTPVEGKNNGAEGANGDILLFLDADLILPENFFAGSLAEFKKRNLKFASFCLAPVKKNKIIALLFNLFYNLPILALEKILPHASMAILVKKEVFKKLNGFDKSITIGEDHDLARRARKICRYGILKSSKVLVSQRRFSKDGWSKTYFKYFFCECHMVLLGPVRSNIFKYKFGHYSDSQKKKK